MFVVIVNTPVVNDIYPLFGPIAGGTVFTIYGEYFAVMADSVYVDYIRCTVINQ